MVNVVQGKILITTQKDIENLSSKLEQIKLEHNQFILFTLSTIINQEIIDEIHHKTEADGVSLKIIQRTYLQINNNTSQGKVTFKIISDYTSESGFVVAEIIEHGRRAYVVYPIGNRKNPHLKYIKNGNVIFAKKVNIPEKPAEKYIAKTINMKIKKVQKRVDKEIKIWIQQILRS